MRLRWPAPALLAWAAAWAIFWLAQRLLQLPLSAAVALAAAVALLCSVPASTRLRRIVIAWGFPLSLGLSGLIGDVPGWAWLLPLSMLMLLYPVRSWRDAPLFPTARDALRGLARHAALPHGAGILDAGCGLGGGLAELHREYPHARLVGLEWSWPLRIACAWRSPFATVRRDDIWRTDWSAYDLVYLFQRPESMSRAGAKAQSELRPGAWLASLEFALPDHAADKMLSCPDGRRVWLYRAPLRRR